jgi:hypothetical protein
MAPQTEHSYVKKSENFGGERFSGVLTGGGISEMRQNSEYHLLVQPAWTSPSACWLGDRTDTRAGFTCSWGIDVRWARASRHSPRE